MGAMTTYPHITIDDKGNARIEQTRYKVQHLAAEHYHYGWSAEELMRQHPDLRPEQVYAALAYFYDHFHEIVQRVNEQADQFDSIHKNQPLSRAELLKRNQESA